MIEIEEMAPHETHDLLRRVNFGHRDGARDNRPYVVPIHYATTTQIAISSRLKA